MDVVSKIFFYISHKIAVMPGVFRWKVIFFQKCPKTCFCGLRLGNSCDINNFVLIFSAYFGTVLTIDYYSVAE